MKYRMIQLKRHFLIKLNRSVIQLLMVIMGKLKGISKSTIKNQDDINDYWNAIFNNKSKYVVNYIIDSSNNYRD